MTTFLTDRFSGRRLWMGLVLTLACASCGGGGGGGTGSPIIPAPPNQQTLAPLPIPSQIVFTSDRSVVLSGVGASYQLVAQVIVGTATSGAPITWTSGDNSVATVSASGKVTATAAVGATTIVASSPGLDSQSATIVVAQPTVGSVVVPSSSVLAVSQTSATLKADATTAGIGVGSIIVSGDKGGLLGKVTALQTSGAQTNVTIEPVPLWQAFQKLDIDVASTPISVQTTLSNGRLTIQSHGRQLRDLALGPFTCKTDAGAPIDVAIARPSLSASVSASIVANYHTTWLRGIDDFRLSVVTTVPVTLATGSVTVSVPGHVSATCVARVPQFTIPGVLPLWPIDFVGPTVNMALVISIDANANATLSLVGPMLSATATMTDGVQYTSGAWQVIEQNSNTGPQFTRGGASFSASASADVQSAFRVDLGTTATLVGVPLTTADIAFGSVGAEFNASMSSPFTDTRFAYTGPTWSANLHLQAGPELELHGGLFGVLHQYFGVPSISQQWTLYDRTIPLGGSPTPSISASPAVVKSGSVTLTSNVPASYAGHRLVFVGYLGGANDGAVLGDTTISSDGSAHSTWTPGPSDNGSYQISALLFDPIFDFASLHLPYASPSKATVEVALTAQPPPPPPPPGGTTAPSVTTTSASGIGQNTGTLNGVVTPNGAATNAFFQWGTTTNYGNVTALQALGNGTNSINIAAAVGGLNTNTVYHYRTVATNTVGTTNGSDVTFTTLGSAPSAGPTISGVDPNPVTGSDSRQIVTINGANFVNKPAVTLTWTG